MSGLPPVIQVTAVPVVPTGPITFPPIPPAPARNFVTFDFTSQIQQVPPGSTQPSPAIQTATWSIALEDTSAVDDPDLTSRLIGTPINDATHTSQLVGDMLDTAVYVLTAQVTINDGRILVKSGEISCFTPQEPVVPPVDANTVPFDYDRFILAFPQFVGVNSDTIERMWIIAGLMFRNDETSPEPDLPTRTYLLGLLTAHIAVLFAGTPGQPSGMYAGSTMVGRINSKSVNGVSVGAEGFPGVTGTQTWYLMSQYGALFWKLTAAYRTMHYFPGPQRFPGSNWPYPYGPYSPYAGPFYT
jgi:hypothetical protein